MRQLMSYIRDFFRSQFHTGYFFFIVVLMSLLVFANYYYGLDKVWIGQFARSYVMIFAYWALYGLVFFVPYFAWSVYKNQYSYWKQKPFVSLLLVAPLVFAFQQYFYQHRVWIEEYADHSMKGYYSLGSEYVIRVILLLIPTFVIWQLFDRSNQSFYGFNRNKYGYKPYMLMVLLMIPLIGFASTQQDFLDYYPQAKIIDDTGATGWHKLRLILQFELAYGFNFITIESFFRGFLVLAFCRYAGKAAIIPMACFYCSIHFGKPLFECISSFFGGLILGIISYHTRSIYGGLMVHLGIAWMMEAGAALGNYLR